MVKKILLVCTGGFSTSMLLESMAAACRQSETEIIIDACPQECILNYLPVDLILLAPQVSCEISRLREMTGGAQIQIMDEEDYCSLNGAAVFKRAMEYLNL